MSAVVSNVPSFEMTCLLFWPCCRRKVICPRSASVTSPNYLWRRRPDDIQHSPVNNVPCHCPQCERRYPEQWHFDGHSISTTSWQWYYPSHHNSCVMYSLPEFKLMKENTIYWNMCLVRCWKKEFETRSVTPSTLCWCRRLLDVWLVSEEPHPRVLRQGFLSRSRLPHDFRYETIETFKILVSLRESRITELCVVHDSWDCAKMTHLVDSASQTGFVIAKGLKPLS